MKTIITKQGTATPETALWRLTHDCNIERQAEFGQVWFSRGFIAVDLMTKNDHYVAEENLKRNMPV